MSILVWRPTMWTFMGRNFDTKLERDSFMDGHQAGREDGLKECQETIAKIRASLLKDG